VPLKRYVLTLDLKDDPRGIAAYRKYHREIWPEVRRSLLRIGVRRLDIFALRRRLVMLLETCQDFDLVKSFAAHSASHPRCAEWERLMTGFQQPPPGAKRGQLWTEMEPIFRLSGRARKPTARRGRRRAAR
jgi:L-rhamnose mutarotase